MNTKSCQNEAQNRITALGLKLQFSGFNHPELFLSLEVLLNKPEARIVIGTWLIENDPIMKLDINGYQHKESAPKFFLKQRSVGNAFYFKESIRYYPIQFQTNIEYSNFRILSENKSIETFCVVYSFFLKLNRFFVELEKLLHYLKVLNEKSLIFGWF